MKDASGSGGEAVSGQAPRKTPGKASGEMSGKASENPTVSSALLSPVRTVVLGLSLTVVIAAVVLAVLLVEPRCEDRGVRLNVSLDECSAAGNADYLMQLWTNLLDNAVKFSPDGGVVSVALYGERRGEEGHAAGEAVCWISDEGCGMDAETKRRLFEKFYQGDTSYASEGSGLGLALCKRIVDLHQGAIEVQSTPGKGSVFEVRLPAR